MRSLAAAIAFALLFLAGCTQKITSSQLVPMPDRPVAVWLGWALFPPLPDDAAAVEFTTALRGAGATHLVLEAWDADGNDALTSRTLKVDRLHRAAEASGLRLAAVLPLFIAPASPPEEALSQRAVWLKGRFAITGDPLAAGVRRLSPANAWAVDRERAAVRALVAAKRFDFIVLSGCGFEDTLADVSPGARRAFESWSGFSVREWPGQILGTAAPETPFLPMDRGPLWGAWLAWRAHTAREVFLRLREEAGPGTPLVPLVDAPWSAHLREGLNWSGPDSYAGPENPWLPSRYRETATGGLIDAVALGFWTPDLQTAPQAEQRKFAWWASVEGATAMARRYRASSTRLWAAALVPENATDLEPVFRAGEGALLIITPPAATSASLATRVREALTQTP